MDRQIIYAGQIPLETDLLNSNKNTMVSIAKLVAGLFGTNTYVNGLSVGPTGPASLQVVVQPGEVYATANIDDTAYSSIAADTTHQIQKQGILLDAATLNCPAPPTGGQSINYLIQVAMTEVDTGLTALPYYNASNPSVAWTGPNNSGTQQYTTRKDNAVVTVKAGAAATTGSQTTPAPDAGNVGLYVVTVANGQATIVAGNITQYAGAPLVAFGGAVSGIRNAYYAKNVAGNTNVTLTAQEAAYPIINLTGALTGNINVVVPATSSQWIINNATTGAFTITVKTPAGTGIVITQGSPNILYSEGVNVYSLVSNTVVVASALQGGFRALSGSSTGTSAVVTYAADEIVTGDNAGNYQSLRAWSGTITMTSAGAGGLDTGAVAASTWYYAFAISKADGTKAFMASLSATAPTMPSGYIKWARIGSFRTDGTGNKYPLSFVQKGRRVQYAVVTSSNVPNAPFMASGISGSVTVPTYSAIAVGAFVPPTAASVRIFGSQAASAVMLIAPNAAYGANGSTTNPPPYGTPGNASNSFNFSADFVLESTNIYYAANNASSFVLCLGYEDNL